MIEIPPKFADQPPVNPDAPNQKINTSPGSVGLAEDVLYYGKWLRQKAWEQIGYLYPKVEVPSSLGGGKATVIAWIWARTVKCPNPVCGCEMPLVKSFALSKISGHEAWIEPQLDFVNKKISYRVHQGKGNVTASSKVGRGAKFKCLMCGGIAQPDYIKTEAIAHRLGAQLMAIVAEGANGRLYLSPISEQILAADVEPPLDVPEGKISGDKRALWTPLYGLNTFKSLFTPRQLTALTTFSSLIKVARKQAEIDALKAGMPDDRIPLSRGGRGARAYGEAIGVYLAFAVDKLADFNSSICTWATSRETMRNTFARQAIPMTWDFAEVNPFSDSSGCFTNMLEWVYKNIEKFSAVNSGIARQFNAEADCGLRNVMVSTDPPYYDNIGYADLSDFFYIWLRRSLKEIYPEIFGTLLVPKAEELIATPYRHSGNKEKAKEFFESGMLNACKRIYEYAREDIPVTIYYAYKQSEADSVSTGWETMLNAVLQAGFAITGTWPMRTEMSNRSVAACTNALASSIVLVCRKRSATALPITKSRFINTLRRELRPAMQKLQASNIAPVDLAQAAIGPGMAVFSRYSSILEADGSPMTVRSALQVINGELDTYFNEQVGSLDANSRFCVDLYTQLAYNNIKYGEAEVLANAKGASIAKLRDKGVLFARAGYVHLIEREELPEQVNETEDIIWLLAQQLTRAMAAGGNEACAQIVAALVGSHAEQAKDLAYRLYTIAEQKRYIEEARAYNDLVVAWPDIQARANTIRNAPSREQALFN